MNDYDGELLFDPGDHQLLRDVPDDLVLHRYQPQLSQRLLVGGGGGGNNQNQYLLVDKDGITYDPYSLAWRYLGIYIDCDINASAASGGGGERTPSGAFAHGASGAGGSGIVIIAYPS